MSNTMVDNSDDSIDLENNVNNFGNSKQLEEAARSSRDIFFDESNKLLLHSVSEICIFVAKKCDVTFSKDFVNTLSECLKEKLCCIIQMMEVLAKHAGRSEICLDDFKLYFRTASKEVYSSEQTFDKDDLSINKLSKTVPSLKSVESSPNYLHRNKHRLFTNYNENGLVKHLLVFHNENSDQCKNNVGKKGNHSSFLEFLFEKMTLAVQQNDVLNEPNENTSKKNRQVDKHSTKQISKKVQQSDVLNEPNEDASKGDSRKDKHFTRQISKKICPEENRRSLRLQKIDYKRIKTVNYSDDDDDFV